MGVERFHRGDWVRVAKDLGPSMRHFTADCDAIVIGSYADQYGGKDHDSYTLHLEGRGQSSWYYGSQLTMIERNRPDKLQEWEDAAKAVATQKGSLDWIFSNGTHVLTYPHGASIEALARCFGLNNLWGSCGEGFVYYENATGTLRLATPFLQAGDKAGWLAFCEEIRRPADTGDGK